MTVGVMNVRHNWVKTLKDLKLYDSEGVKDVLVDDLHFKRRQKSCKTVSVDDLCQAAVDNVELIDSVMDGDDLDREQINFLLGQRWVYEHFFNLEDDE